MGQQRRAQGQHEEDWRSADSGRTRRVSYRVEYNSLGGEQRNKEEAVIQVAITRLETKG